MYQKFMACWQNRTYPDILNWIIIQLSDRTHYEPQGYTNVGYTYTHFTTDMQSILYSMTYLTDSKIDSK